MQELLSLLGLAGGGLLTGEAYNKLGEMGSDAMNQSRNIADQAIGQDNFTGYGVTGPVGGTSIDATGNTSFNLNSGQQGMMNQYGNLAQSFAGQAGMDQSGRENDIYQRIRAMQSPEEQRQQLELESRLAAQGRTGVRTNMYGGTPEQLALSKARAEAQNSAAYQSIDQARAQQLQDTNMSGMFNNMQYSPLDQLRQNFASGANAYGYKDISGRQNQNIMAEALMGGLDAKLASRLGQANLMGELGTSLIGGAGGMMSSVINAGTNTLSQFGSNIWDTLFG